MVAVKERALALAPEWGERIPSSERVGITKPRREGRAPAPRIAPITRCERCGQRREENPTRRTERLQQRRVFICRDCRASDPEYVKMMHNRQQEELMSRLTYAARQLIEQVKALPGLEKHEVVVKEGEPDGIDVVREIKFDSKTTDVLWPLMKDNLDGRIASAVVNRGILTLTFQSQSQQADDAAAFDLPRAAEPTSAADDSDDDGE